MIELKKAMATIRYKTEYGVEPSVVRIAATTPLTSEHLPELSASGRVFNGWVHVNKDGHESSLSERMVISSEWLIPTETVDEYYVYFTAKWKNKSKSASGTIYEGEYIVTPKVTAQTLPTAEKLMEDDVTVKSIPYFDVSNTVGGSTVYIGTEV